MTTTFTLPLTSPIPPVLKKKRVLLVDTSSTKRDLRAEAMRKLGIDVDCACDIPEARSWWRADLYDLVLVNLDEDSGHRDKFCEDVRGATPPQSLAFLVGKPDYLADSPGADCGQALQIDEVQINSNDVLIVGVRAALNADPADRPLRWGILEASRRISAVRSASQARTRAMRDRPAPPRDSEARPTRRTTVSATLDDLLRREELR